MGEGTDPLQHLGSQPAEQADLAGRHQRLLRVSHHPMETLEHTPARQQQ